MKDNNYVLAMYDIRAKQEFIFKTNHIKEIIGASAIIRDCFDDYLYTTSYGKKIFHDRSHPFNRDNFKKHIEEQGYIGELVYDGGGNFILIFKDIETYRNTTFEFTKAVLEKIGTLKILSSYIEGVDFDNYKSDSKELYRVHALNESSESNVSPWGTLPIVQVDRKTSLPLIAKKKVDVVEEKLSKESLAKYEKFDTERKNTNKEFDEKNIDVLVKRKGEDSLLAIVYIDGNNMGAKVQKCIEGLNSYEECIARLREFSNDIQDKYITERKTDIFEYLRGKRSENDMYKWRLVLGAGDEINFICNAHDALPLALKYLESLPKGCSSCAGIAIFHSHDPYSEVYRVAEECCESGKSLMKKYGISEGCFVDFHYCQGAIDVSLEQIRESEGTTNEYWDSYEINRWGISRPWFVPTRSLDNVSEISEAIKKAHIVTMEEVDKVVDYLKLLGRGNVKGLVSVAKGSLQALKLELKRIVAHSSEGDRKKLNEMISIEELDGRLQKLIYDVVISYDLWFREENRDEK